jgi:hypothetical protein
VAKSFERPIERRPREVERPLDVRGLPVTLAGFRPSGGQSDDEIDGLKGHATSGFAKSIAEAFGRQRTIV